MRMRYAIYPGRTEPYHGTPHVLVTWVLRDWCEDPDTAARLDAEVKANGWRWQHRGDRVLTHVMVRPDELDAYRRQVFKDAHLHSYDVRWY